MLISQIKLTLAAFVQRGIHQGLPSPQHSCPSFECKTQPPEFVRGALRPHATWVLQQQSRRWAAKSPGPDCRVLFRAPREPSRKMAPAGGGRPNRGSGSFRPSPGGTGGGVRGAGHWSLTRKPSQAVAKPHSQKRSNETIVFT